MNECGHWLRWAAVLSLLAAVIAIGLIATGVFDPRPIGAEQWQRPLTAEVIPANSRRLIWLDGPLPGQRYSVRLTVAFQSGEPDISYGLVLGNETEHLAVAVSPLGYVAIWQETNKQLPVLFSLQPSANPLPWQTWPHVKTGAEPNEIWVDVDQASDPTNSLITVRINREWLWSGKVEIPEAQIGLLVESFGEAAVVDFQNLQLLSE